MEVFWWLLLIAALLYPFFRQTARDKKMAEKKMKVENRPFPPAPPKAKPVVQETISAMKEEVQPSIPALLRRSNLQEAVILSEILHNPYLERR